MSNHDRTLWRSVITQALEDATRVITLGSSRTHTQQQERREARAWLTKPNEDFDSVCSLAGLEPDAVRELARQRIGIADGTIAPAPKAEPRRRRPKAPSFIQNDPKPRLYSHEGKTMSLTQWARHLGIAYGTLTHRIRQGWPINEVLNTQNLTGKRLHRG